MSSHQLVTFKIVNSSVSLSFALPLTLPFAPNFPSFLVSLLHIFSIFLLSFLCHPVSLLCEVLLFLPEVPSSLQILSSTPQLFLRHTEPHQSLVPKINSFYSFHPRHIYAKFSYLPIPFIPCLKHSLHLQKHTPQSINQRREGGTHEAVPLQPASPASWDLCLGEHGEGRNWAEVWLTACLFKYPHY